MRVIHPAFVEPFRRIACVTVRRLIGDIGRGRMLDRQETARLRFVEYLAIATAIPTLAAFRGMVNDRGSRHKQRRGNHVSMPDFRTPGGAAQAACDESNLRDRAGKPWVTGKPDTPIAIQGRGLTAPYGLSSPR
jgi:hypothetical protein